MQGLFNMTSDSHLFRTAAQLDEEGFYPIEGNRWKRGEELHLPLYEGKMVQAFDHRAASIANREGNLFRPGQPDRTLDEEYSIGIRLSHLVLDIGLASRRVMLSRVCNGSCRSKTLRRQPMSAP